MGKEQTPKLCMMEKDTAKAKCGKHTEETHSADHNEKIDHSIVRTHQQHWTARVPLHDEANAPFIIGNGEINAGSMRD